MQIHIGCSGWFYWHWKKIFYPEDIPTHHWFRHYASVFDTVELNAPFYRWPKPATVKSWRRNAPAGFRYAVKVNQLITHEKRMVHTKKLVKEFCSIADVLGGQMGCFLFQFPPSYRYTTARLKSIVTQLAAEAGRRAGLENETACHLVVEFRHKSWWRKTVQAAFSKAGIVFCSVSAPRLPEEIGKSGKVVYLRFHGLNRWYRHDYSAEELREWAQRIKRSRAREVWIYFNNDREGFAIKNAKLLERELKRILKKNRRRRGHEKDFTV